MFKLIRFLPLATCVWVASVATVHAQQPTVSLSLNLRYNDPADPTEGGTFTLVAKTTSAFGIAAIDAYISNIDSTGLAYASGIGVSNPVVSSVVPGGLNIVYRQDATNGPVVLNVGRTTGPANVPNDPLKNFATWNNSSTLVTGTFGASRPAFITASGIPTNADTFASDTTTPPVSTIHEPLPSLTVRGDSIGTLGLNLPSNAGLFRGDTDRDFDVDGDDLTGLLFSYGSINMTWDRGDVTDGLAGHVEGVIDSDDVNWVLFYFNLRSTSPVTTAVPEPSTYLVILILVPFLHLAPLPSRDYAR